MSTPSIKRPSEQSPEHVAADAFARLAPAGRSRAAQNLDPKAFPTSAFHVRFNQFDLWALGLVAELDSTSKQRIARLAIREYVARRLKKAGVQVP